MDEEQLTKLIELIFERKPYLRILENQFSEIEYGQVTVTFTIHRNQVESMKMIIQENTWNRQKDKPSNLDLNSKT